VPASSINGDKVSAEVSAEGYEAFSWEGGLELGTVRLAKARTIDGVVRDQRGAPVPGAVVTGDNSSDEATSAADGSFRLTVARFEAGRRPHAGGQQRGTASPSLGGWSRSCSTAPTHVDCQVIDSRAGRSGERVSMRDSEGDDELRAEAGADGSVHCGARRGRVGVRHPLNAAGQSFQLAGQRRG